MANKESTNNEAATGERSLTKEEQALYDRQIRLWGVEAQRKLASSRVLIIGDPTNVLVQELAKNVVLAGIARLELLRLGEESSPVALRPGLFERPGFLGANDSAVADTLRSMNPLVDVRVRTLSKEGDGNKEASLDALDVTGYRLVCCVGLRPHDELTVSRRARSAAVPTFYGTVAGEVGWFFVDSCNKTLKHKATKKVYDSVAFHDAFDTKWGGEIRKGEFGWHVFRTLAEFQSTHDGLLPTPTQQKDVEDMYDQLVERYAPNNTKKETVLRAAKGAQFVLPPMASILGGMWGREAVKVIAGREIPLQGFNFFFYNAATSTGSVEKVALKRE